MWRAIKLNTCTPRSPKTVYTQSRITNNKNVCKIPEVVFVAESERVAAESAKVSMAVGIVKSLLNSI